jgi:predicted Ser/Thr protein kinase
MEASPLASRLEIASNHVFTQGDHMNELVSLIVKKTGIPDATARTIVNLVVDYLKKKLPAPVAGQIDALLSNSAGVQQAESLMGNLASKLGKKK